MNPWPVELPCQLGTKIYCDHPRWRTGCGIVKEFVLTQDANAEIQCQIYIDWQLQACPNPMTFAEFKKYCKVVVNDKKRRK